MDNSIRCVLLGIYQTSSIFFASVIYRMTICLFIEITMYAETLTHDVKSHFSQMDLIIKSKFLEFLMLECCKEAVDFHKRINQ